MRSLGSKTSAGWRSGLVGVVSALGLVGAAGMALAQGGVIISGSVDDDPKPTDPAYVVCYTADEDAKVVYITSNIVTMTYAQTDDLDWRAQLKARYHIPDDSPGGCNVHRNLKDAEWRLNDFNTTLGKQPNYPQTQVHVDWTPHFKAGGPASGKVAAHASPTSKPAEPDRQAEAAARREKLQLAAVMKEMGLPPGREADAQELLRKRKEAGLPMPSVPDEPPAPKNCRSVATKLDGWTLEGMAADKRVALVNAKRMGPSSCLIYNPGPVALAGTFDRSSCRSAGGKFLCSWHFTCRGPATEQDCGIKGPAKGSAQ